MIAFRVLMRVENGGGYSNISLSEALEGSGLEPRDKAFATRLVYGVLEKSETIGHVISSYVKKGVSVEPEVLCLLQMAVYQMVFMNTPDSAAVNESVNLAKKLKLFRATGFINGLLRRFIRDGKQVRLPDENKEPLQYLSVRYSCPMWLVRLWTKSYGMEICRKILASLEGRPPLFVRVNTSRTTSQELCQALEAEGVKAEPHPLLPDCLSVEETGDVTSLAEYSGGLFHVQDGSSQLCCASASPKGGGTVYDVCAAPGGKSFTMAELMGNQGTVISCDLHPHRVELIAEGAKRLGLTCIKSVVRDALDDSNAAECADLVLCDVPCSGLGIIRRKPDIKRKAQDEIASLPALQARILENSAKLVRKGGRLVYSTCTLNPAENLAVIENFLAKHSEFVPCPIDLPEGISRTVNEPDYAVTIFPHIFNTDGFFISTVIRKD